MGFNVKVYIFGGLLLFGFLLMAGASIADIQTEAGKFANLFYVGLGAVSLGTFLKVTGNGD
jgi:hypothetical protein